MGIVHRDIKLENVLYENHGKNSTVRMIDFGLSKTFDRASIAADYARTPYTMSPETFTAASSSNKSAEAEVMTEKTDVWAVGVMTFIMLSGEFTFIKTNADLNDAVKMERLKKVRSMKTLSCWIRTFIFSKSFGILTRFLSSFVVG